MTDPTSGAWQIIRAYLAGTEGFESAAGQLATILRNWGSARGRPDDPNPGDILWIPSSSVPEVDRPKISKLIERTMELLQDGDGEAA